MRTSQPAPQARMIVCLQISAQIEVTPACKHVLDTVRSRAYVIVLALRWRLQALLHVLPNVLDCRLAAVHVNSMLSRRRRFRPSDNVIVRLKGQVHASLFSTTILNVIASQPCSSDRPLSILTAEVNHV